MVNTLEWPFAEKKRMMIDGIWVTLNISGQEKTRFYQKSERGFNLVGGLNPSEKYESQLVWLETQYMGKK